MLNWVLRWAHKQRRSAVRSRFKRTLPAGDYINDRWEKARFLGFGENSSIYDSSLVFDNVKVGSHVWVGPFTLLDGSGGLLQIGDHCHISAGSQIYTHDTVNTVTQGLPTATANVTIGNNCYIGPNTVIAMGVTIGDNVIIGCNSFVNRDIPSNSKGHGTPFRVHESLPPLT